MDDKKRKIGAVWRDKAFTLAHLRGLREFEIPVL